MTTAKTFLGQCLIVLGIFFCNAQPWIDESSGINCELFPYHKFCRGTMTKKMAIAPRDMRSYGKPRDDCLDSKSTPFEKRQNNIPNYLSYSAIPESKLWMSLLNVLNADDAYAPKYDRGHKKSRNNHQNDASDWKLPQMEARFLADMDRMEADY